LRRPKLVLSSSLAAIGLSASIALAQQSPRAPSSTASPATSANSVDPSMANRPTRYLLRNGQDYLAFQEYARALSFFRAVEARQNELSDTEVQALKKGIAQAQQGLREAVNSPRVVAQGKGRTVAQPGSFALAKAAKAPIDSIQLASVELPAPTMSQSTRNGPVLPAPIPQSVAMPDPDPISAPAVAQAAAPASSTAPAPSPSSASGVELPPLPNSLPVMLPAPSSGPSLPSQGPTVDPSTLPTQLPSTVELPPSTPSPLPSEPPPPLVLESSTPSPTPTQVELPPASTPSTVEVPPPVELPPASTPSASPAPVEVPPASTSPPVPMPGETTSSELPSLPGPVETAPPVATPRAMVAEAGQQPDSGTTPQPVSAPEPPPAAEVPPSPESRTVPSMPVYPAPPATLPSGPPQPILSDRVRREVEEIAQQSRDRTPGGSLDPTDPGMTPSQGSPRLAIERAPSPTEARPLRRIPVPEEFVPLGKREWDPNRKYWAAAGTCHMILYFQDPVLERYGQSAEQAIGPWGRYFSYPLDDPKQSNQRNQIVQPFYSMGKFLFQIGTLPYKLVVDPPWEAEYDLGYYRPGDRIPTDTIFITPYGVGPPLKGRNY
jgi:hypothetical protein